MRATFALAPIPHKDNRFASENPDPIDLPERAALAPERRAGMYRRPLKKRELALKGLPV